VNSNNQNARDRWEEIRNAPGQARRWDWYALLRLIQCATPDQHRIGHSIKLEQEAVRLGQPPFFHPPPTNMAGMRTRGPREDDSTKPAADANAPHDSGRPLSKNETPWIYSYHFGLFGPHGPLPLHLTEYAYRQKMANDPAFTAFCDTLHHRFLSFFFRAWADARKELDWDRHDAAAPAATPGGRDEAQRSWWDLYVGSLIGLGLDATRQRDRVPDHAKLFYAGRLMQPVRNAGGLRAILQDYFEVVAEVIPFVRKVIKLPASARWKLGPETSTGWLGRSTIVGETIEDYQTGFRIRFGPLKLAQFKEFLPETAGFGQLHDWVRLYLGKETDPNPQAGIEAAWDLQLVLSAPEVPWLVLGMGSTLGWTTWLISKQPTRDAEDLVVTPPPDSLKSTAKRGAEERAGAARL
jgi:type VI secretion system protein ImpH